MKVPFFLMGTKFALGGSESGQWGPFCKLKTVRRVKGKRNSPELPKIHSFSSLSSSLRQQREYVSEFE